MPSVNPALSGIAASTAAGQVGREPSANLDKDAFLRLLVEQLRHQDPTAPQDPTQQFAQISQMTLVEQVTKLAASAQASADEAKLSRSMALVGRTVSWLDGDVTRTGVVERVKVGEAGPTLTISGQDGVDPAKVSEVA